MPVEKTEPNSKSSLGILPYIVAVGAGLSGAAGAALTTIRTRFNRDLRRTKTLSHINDPYIADLEKFNVEFFQEKTIDALSFCKKIGERKVEHVAKIADELKNRGFPTGLKGLKLQYTQLSPGSKNAMRINSGITAAVAFCGAMTLFNNIHTRRQMDTLVGSQLDKSTER